MSSTNFIFLLTGLNKYDIIVNTIEAIVKQISTNKERVQPRTGGSSYTPSTVHISGMAELE